MPPTPRSHPVMEAASEMNSLITGKAKAKQKPTLKFVPRPSGAKQPSPVTLQIHLVRNLDRTRQEGLVLLHDVWMARSFLRAKCVSEMSSLVPHWAQMTQASWAGLVHPPGHLHRLCHVAGPLHKQLASGWRLLRGHVLNVSIPGDQRARLGKGWRPASSCEYPQVQP